MAQRTITNAGGTFNVAGTWVEGAVPGTGDHIVGLATSGPLTLTDSRSIQRIDFTDYQNLFTITASGVLQCGLAAGANTFSATMSFEVGGTTPDDRIIAFNGGNATIAQLGTQEIPNVRIFTSKILNSDLYVKNLRYSSSNTATQMTNNNIYISGNLIANSGTGETDGFFGTTVHHCNGSGLLNIKYGNQTSGITSSVIVNGTYSSQAFLRMDNNSYLMVATSSDCSDLNVFLEDDWATLNENYTIEAYSPIDNLIIEARTNNTAYGIRTINLGNTLVVNKIATSANLRQFTSDATVPVLKFVGSGLSASEFYTNPTIRTPSSGSAPFPLTLRSNDIELDPGFTHSFGNLFLQGASDDKSYFSASTAGTVNIIVNNGLDSAIGNYDFTNINASGGEKLYALNGTLTNTTNIENTIPTGGTGGGTAAGPYAFATIN